MKKAIVAAAIALTFYTVVDIMIWGQLFETKLLWHYHDIAAPVYHGGWAWMLIGEMVLGSFLLLPDKRAAIAYVTTLYLFAVNGMEDVMYYVFWNHRIPDLLPWLDNNPLIFFKPVTRETLVLNVVLWFVLYILFANVWTRMREAYPRLFHATEANRRFTEGGSVEG